LSSHDYRFLSIAVREGAVIASFEEEEIGSPSNQSFFLYKDGAVIRSKGGHMASFSFNGETYHLYGYASRQ